MGGLFGALGISASGMAAERLRMDVTAENLANADTTRTASGAPYQRKEVVLQATSGTSFSNVLSTLQAGTVQVGGSQPAGSQQQGVEVAAIVADPSPARRVYDPGHPDADAQGYVTLPNVNTVTEMTDLIAESRSYEANAQALQSAKTLYTKTLELLR
jgi:flagellar basal-body rod protein FlgC